MFLLIGLIVNGLTQSYFFTNFPRIGFPGLERPYIDLRNTYKRFIAFFFCFSAHFKPYPFAWNGQKGKKMNWVVIMTFDHQGQECQDTWKKETFLKPTLRLLGYDFEELCLNVRNPTFCFVANASAPYIALRCNGMFKSKLQQVEDGGIGSRS